MIKQLAYIFSAVILFHVAFFSLIQIKEHVEIPDLQKKPLLLTALYEETAPTAETENQLDKILNAFVPKNHYGGLPKTQIVSTHLFEDDKTPLKAWLEAYSEANPFFKAAPRTYPEVEIRFIGKSLTARTNPPMYAWDDKAKRFICLYEIGIDGKKGEVIFTRLIKGDIPVDIQKKAETALLALQFQPSNEMFVKGTVEIIVTKAF